jgi:hypothetical protein
MRNPDQLYRRACLARTAHGRAAAETLGADAPRAEIYAAAKRLLRYQAAIDAGRQPGRQGRPITSSHPRAAYWRERYKKTNNQRGGDKNGQEDRDREEAR